MWLRNYYNILTANLLCDDTLTSTTQPTDYSIPIMVHKANNTWENAGAANPGFSSSFTYVSKYLIHPFDKGGDLNTSIRITLSSAPTSLVNNNDVLNLAFGTGSTPASYDDYKLETAITSGLTLVSAVGTLTQPSQYDSATHHVTSTRSFTVNNSSASPITINEFGLYAPYGDNGKCCLIYRDVLATPVTLNPSESAIISFTRDAEVYNYTPY